MNTGTFSFWMLRTFVLVGALAGCDVVAPILDSTPPRITLVVPTDSIWPDSVWAVSGRVIDNNRVARVTYTVDDGEEHDFRIHPGRFVEFSGGVRVPADGPMTVVVTAYDAAHNHVSKSVSFETDITGPVIDANLPDTTVTADSTLPISAVIRDPSGVARVRIWYNLGYGSPQDVPITPDTVVSVQTDWPLQAGRYPLELEAMDAVGHWSSVSGLVVTDRTAPHVRLYSPVLSAGGSAHVIVAVADGLSPWDGDGAVSRVALVESDGETSLWTGVARTAIVNQLLPAPSSPAVWTVAAYDEAGNRGVDSVHTRPVAEVVAVAAGGAFSCALDGTGQAWCWGAGDAGQLGDGGTVNSPEPVAVAGGHDFVAITAGFHHACGLDATGAAWCWGSNEYGQLGDGTTSQGLEPVAVAGGISFSSLSAGGQQTCGLEADGNAWCWGGYPWGQLGAGDTSLRSAPVHLQGLTFRQIAPASDYGCGLALDDTMLCWGSYPTAPSTSSTPVRLSTPRVMTRLWAGNQRVAAVDTSGVGWLWNFGWTAPQRIGGVSELVDIALGGQHLCVLQAGGVVLCWGDNEYGQIGAVDGSQDHHTPYPALQGTHFRGLAAGSSHTCAIDTRGSVICWGADEHGQTGH